MSYSITFNANRMTMNALKNKAVKIAQKIKNDKNAELKSQLNTRLTETWSQSDQ
jgi:hypothetical protein